MAQCACFLCSIHVVCTVSIITRALLRLERTMNLLEGREGGGERVERGRREGGEGTWGREGGGSSASSRITFLPVQAQPTPARSSRRAVVTPRGRARSSHWAIFLLNNIAITNNSTFPKIKLHYSM